MKRKIGFLITILSMALLAGCGKNTEAEIKTYSWDEADVYEAENGSLYGGCKVASAAEGYSGTGYVEGFADEGDSVTVSIHIEEAGFYDLNFVSASSGGDYKENYVSVDGESVGVAVVNSGTFTDSVIERVYLTAGDHDVNVSKYWGWIMLDEIKVKHSDDIDPSIYEINRELINPNASDEAK